MRRFLNVVRACLIILLFVIPVLTMFNTIGLAGDVRLKDKYPPSWYQILPAEKRFVLVMNDEAVLDKETGLVWERSPSPELIYNSYNVALQRICEKVIANRMGWRLPTIVELLSLVDITQKNPALPKGHLFKNIQPGAYYSTTVSGIGFWGIDFSNGQSVTFGGDRYLWFVRGGYGPLPQ